MIRWLFKNAGPDLCDPDWIQTNDLQLRRLPLYSAELPGLVAAANVIFN